ncbi:hypothetical protein M405DRAFT_805638, partial [Rhizopogon salebrosus TDB-379]
TVLLALTLRACLQDLITAMVFAAQHRTDTQFDHPVSLYENGTPMWSIVVRSDVAKQPRIRLPNPSTRNQCQRQHRHSLLPFPSPQHAYQSPQHQKPIPTL